MHQQYVTELNIASRATILTSRSEVPSDEMIEIKYGMDKSVVFSNGVNLLQPGVHEHDLFISQSSSISKQVRSRREILILALL